MAKKKTQQKTNAMRMVEQHKVPYREYEFTWSEGHLSAESVTESSGIGKGRIFKILVMMGNKTDPVVAVIPGNQELDSEKLAKANGNRKVGILHLKDLEAATDYIRGGCSSIGIKKQLSTHSAEEVRQYSTIIVSTSKCGMQIKPAFEAVLSLTNG